MATELETAQADLVKVRSAIDAALSMQSYSVVGRSVERPELATLYEERTRLENKIKRLTRGGRKFNRVIPL